MTENWTHFFFPATPTVSQMIESLSSPSEKAIGFQLSGKLHDEDYQTFVPAVDHAIEAEGKARILAWFHDFEGWDLQALWDDIKFATSHCNKIERIALVGESKWEEWMSKVCKPFTLAKIQYFDASQIDEAWKWVCED